MTEDEIRQEQEKAAKAAREEEAVRAAHNAGGRAGSAMVTAHTGASGAVRVEINGADISPDEGRRMVTQVKNSAGIDEPPPEVVVTPQASKKEEEHGQGAQISEGELGHFTPLAFNSGVHRRTVKGGDIKLPAA